ncbi:MAG: 2-hydroxyacyl-CoA dehydratase [Bacteroidales bacterium]|nr:2-hydroxyacyl-CoA dehydratase [Bacteroidales bacterium]
MKEEIKIPALLQFKEVARAPYEYLRELKKTTGVQMIGSSCTYTPEEIILAAGLHPFRIFAESQSLSRADAHIQAYGCSMVRGMLEDGLSGNLDFLDGVVFPHACDSIQRLSDIWRLNVRSLHFDLLLPVKLDTPLAKSYFEKVTERFRRDLERAFDVAITEEALIAAIELMNEFRNLLRKLYLMQSQYPGIMKGSDLGQVVEASMVMDKKKAVALLKEWVSELEAGVKPEKINKKRILISGSVCSHPDIHQIIEANNAVVVYDDLCSGSRYFEGIISNTGNPVQAIAGRYTERYVCPAKHLGVGFQMENMKKLIQEHKVDAVLFLLLKFCEPFSFDYPDIKKELEAMKLPFLMVEMDRHNEVDEQMRTRIDTLLEIL